MSQNTPRGNKRSNPARRTSTLYITGLDVSITDRDLKEECSKFGKIKRVTIIKDKETRTSKGFGYLLFYNEDEATKALKELDGRVMSDKPVKCKYSHSETPEWQMILDNRRAQQNGRGAPMPMRGRGASTGRGQGRGGMPMRGGRPDYADEDVAYPSQRAGRPMSQGRGGGPPGRGGPAGRGAAPSRGGYPSRGGQGAPAGGIGILDTPGYDDSRPPYEERDYREPDHLREPRYEREPAPGRDRAPPSRDPYDRAPARYDDRPRENPRGYDDREADRRYAERQAAIYDERPSRDGRSILPDPRSAARPGDRGGQYRDDYDPYAPPRQQSRDPISRGPPPREATLRDQYLYDRPSETDQAPYSNERYPERAPPRSDDRRALYDAPRDRAAPPPSRDPYESRKRPATGYAGYDDVYDQPPARVPRSTAGQYGSY